jgi:hypothetical protein
MRWHLQPVAICVLAFASLALVHSAQAFHGLHCHCPTCNPCHHSCCRCVVCCQQPAAPVEDRREAQETKRSTRGSDVVRAAVVPSMPMYTMPMMYAAMPVMPAVATQPTRGAEYRGAGDCCDRVDKLEVEMRRMAESVNNLQVLVMAQSKAIEALAAPKTP